MEVTESERIDTHAGPLAIVAFSTAVPTVIQRGMLGAPTQHAPSRWVIMVWTGVPSREYSVKEPEKGHDNESDQGQVSYDDDGYVHREEEELMEKGRIFIDQG